MSVNQEILGPSILGITTAVGAVNSFLPNITEVRKASADGDPSFAADVRMGEVATVALAVGVGALVSSLTGSSVPVAMAVLASVGLVVLYESTLRADRPMEPKGSNA